MVLHVAFAVVAAAESPCDITGKAGNPCVAAHSTVRALYAAYDGPLYNVTRISDGKSINVGVLKAGGFANITTHDTFCAKLDCVISNVFDQSPQGNHLYQRHKLVNASQHKITVGGGIFVYGMWFEKGYGYHVDDTTGIAKGNEPESIYAVMSGTHYNGGCCFDYGNSENSKVSKNISQGAGTMEAIYFGNAHWQNNTGEGTGPWVGADLECGMYYGGGNATKVNNQSKTLSFPFVSLYLRGGTDGMALKGGDATSGAFMTMYDGPRPDCKIAGTCHRHGNHTYQPMSKKGAIILATGGDNSNGAKGSFYEGIMVTGTTTDQTDDAVQANIVSVGYKNYGPHCVEKGKSTCYMDSIKNRIMGNFVLKSQEMTREQCMQLCYSRQKTLAGVENGNQCMCGDSLKAPKPSTACTKMCGGNSSELCGGYDAIDIMHFTC